MSQTLRNRDQSVHPLPANGNIAFINLSYPDDSRRRNVQTQIRRHVMRDIGKSRQRKRRPKTIPLEISMDEPRPKQHDHIHFQNSNSSPIDLTTAVSLGHAGQPGRPLGPLGLFVVEPDARVRELLQFMMSVTDHSYRPFRTTWIALSIRDTSAFNLSLAYAALFLDQRRGVPNLDFMDNTESIKYYSRTLDHLKSRLSDAVDRISEGVISTILGLICHDATICNWDRWSVHMNGLEHIYRLRGSFEGLGNNIPLIAFWLDLSGAAVLDSCPRFPPPRELFDASVTALKPSQPPLPLVLRLNQISPNLAPVGKAIDLMSLIATTLNRDHHQAFAWESHVGAVKLLGPAIHHLLSMQRLPENFHVDRDSDLLILSEMVRLACLILLAHLKKRLSFDANEVDSLQERLRGLVAQTVKDRSPETADLKLWALITTALLQSSEKRVLLVYNIRKQMTSGGIAGAGDVIETARRIVWIEALQSEEVDNLSREIENAYPQI